MNFFAAQDRARRNTVLLVVLFCAAVVGIVVLSYLALALLLGFGGGGAIEPGAFRAASFDLDLFIKVAAAVSALILGGTIYKWLALSAGGGAGVAESLGGRLVLPAAADAAERRLLNIVDEMAIASGVPAPQVYIVPGAAINAFAAGASLSDAVIGVSQGALQQLSRDEMQGVIAHEFSHIVHGDMRLNLRLIGILHGILLLGYIGYFLLRSSFWASAAGSRRSGGQAALAMMAAGAALAAIGFVGTFFGNWIRAAASRQREYLADASAVQYTRNPAGIGGALQKIGVLGGLIENPAAASCRHLFFAEGVAVGFANPFATHPPLKERIRRILPDWDGEATVKIAPQQIRADDEKNAASERGGSFAPLAGLAEVESRPTTPTTAAAFEARIGNVGGDACEYARRLLAEMPPRLLQAAEDSYSARALIYAMVIERRDEACRKAQLAHLRDFADAGVYDLTLALLPEMRRRAFFLPLAEIAMPALRTMSKAQYERFRHNLAALIDADEAITLFEWALEAMVVHHLDRCFGAGSGRGGIIPDFAKAAAECEYALSLLARAGHGAGGAAAAFGAAAAQISHPLRYLDDAFDPTRLYDCLQKINRLAPRRKEQFIQAALASIAHNGVINRDEAELLRAFANLLDCPICPVDATISTVR